MKQERERAINVPGPVLALMAAIFGCFAIQSAFGVDRVAATYGFAPQQLFEGNFAPLVIALFLHGGWLHALANAGFALAFATPVARRMEMARFGVPAFFVFYLICGVVGNLGYAAHNPHGENPLIGASGAVAGMMGAASRLMWPGPGLAPFRSPMVLGLAASWIVINVIFGMVLIGWTPGSGGAPIAWEAHLAGYAAGLFLLAPTLHITDRLGR